MKGKATHARMTEHPKEYKKKMKARSQAQGVETVGAGAQLSCRAGGSWLEREMAIRCKRGGLRAWQEVRRCSHVRRRERAKKGIESMTFSLSVSPLSSPPQLSSDGRTVVVQWGAPGDRMQE
mmetsp:Transcript_24126/g.47389  ORF Transcript_24126/g.47389 Transcript_24126/m.47389 type:complete len:122 (+) Transcript_24126:1281-1646(+)